MSIEKITVICVRYGTRYGIDYVERLRNMVARNLTTEYEFVCLTDDQTPIDGVRLIYEPASNYSKLWWHKIHLFNPKLAVSGKILYFDLDIVIGNNINKLVENVTTKLKGIRDFNRKFHASWTSLNSSVMCWNHGTCDFIYKQFKKDQTNALHLHGDQDWIWKVAKDTIEFWPDEWIQSYKWEIRSRDELVVRSGIHGFKTVSTNPLPLACCVAVFHGEPKPQIIKDTVVIDNWK